VNRTTSYSLSYPKRNELLGENTLTGLQKGKLSLGGLTQLWEDSVFLHVTCFQRPDNRNNSDETKGTILYECDAAEGRSKLQPHLQTKMKFRVQQKAGTSMSN
jgi:hypothetical protein